MLIINSKHTYIQSRLSRYRTLKLNEVAILTSSHSTFDTRIFHKEARSLVEAGYDVTLITPHHEDVVRDGVEVVSIGDEDVESAGLGDARRIYRKAKELDVDVYHFHDAGLVPFGVMLSYTTDAKVVYDCHEDYGRAFRYYSFPPDYLNPFTTRLYPSVQSMAAKRMDAVVAATDWIAEDFRRRGHEEVVLVRNFPRKSLFNLKKAPVEKKHDYALVYVGNITEERGLYRMLDLIIELRNKGVDAALWLVGDLRGKAREQAKKYLQEHDLDELVRRFGYVEPDNLGGYIEAADVGLCLLDRGRAEHVIPTKIFEYMYCRLPVVATRTTATERYLPSSCGRLVDEEDGEWADVAEELLEDPELRREMGEVGRKKVESEYCWEEEQKELLDLYDRLI